MKRVLIVDDEREITEALGELLSETYRVTLAYDGAQALGILQAGGIDAIVLDLMMPIMSGETLVSELHARGMAVPVIFASAAADLPMRAQRSQVSDFIAKPFDLGLLEKKLARVLGAGGPGGSSTPGPTSRTDPSETPGGHGVSSRRPVADSARRCAPAGPMKQ